MLLRTPFFFSVHIKYKYPTTSLRVYNTLHTYNITRAFSVSLFKRLDIYKYFTVYICTLETCAVYLLSGIKKKTDMYYRCMVNSFKYNAIFAAGTATANTYRNFFLFSNLPISIHFYTISRRRK